MHCDELRNIAYINISGCECFKMNWKYYHGKASPVFIGFTYKQADESMNKILKETKFNVTR